MGQNVASFAVDKEALTVITGNSWTLRAPFFKVAPPAWPMNSSSVAQASAGDWSSYRRLCMLYKFPVADEAAVLPTKRSERTVFALVASPLLGGMAANRELIAREDLRCISAAA
jgi:hypothetical protein